MPPATAPQHLVIFGRPGSGKSSLAEHLGDEFGYKLVRTGEMLREAIRRGDNLGTRVASHLARGDLVPDQLILEMLEVNLKSPDATRLLFDGFPRTLGQVPLLEAFEADLGFTIDCYLDVVVTHPDAVARMTGRRICPVCGAIYHLIAKPPLVAETCDLDGARLERRKDDADEVVEFRQRLYDEQTQPAIDYYKTHKAEYFRVVEGGRSVAEVYDETRRVLGLKPV